MRHVRSPPIAACLLLLLPACDDSPAGPPDLLARVELLVDPDTASLRVGDSAVLEVADSLGVKPVDVTWRVLPASTGSEVDGATLTFRPREAGTYWIRAEAVFADARRGDATRRFEVQPNAAPLVDVEGWLPPLPFRVAVGEPFTAVAVVTDPDDPPGSHRTAWFEARDGALLALGAADSLSLPTDSARVWDLRLRVTDPHGARTLAGFEVEVYDPDSGAEVHALRGSPNPQGEGALP